MDTPTPRPGRGQQARPSRRRQIELYRQLDEMARQGDPHAAGWLLLLSEPLPKRVQVMP